MAIISPADKPPGTFCLKTACSWKVQQWRGAVEAPEMAVASCPAPSQSCGPYTGRPCFQSLRQTPGGGGGSLLPEWVSVTRGCAWA